MTFMTVGALTLGAAFSLYLYKRSRSAHMNWPELLRRMDRINPRSVIGHDMPQTVAGTQRVIEPADGASNQGADTDRETREGVDTPHARPGKIFRPQFGASTRELPNRIRVRQPLTNAAE